MAIEERIHALLIQRFKRAAASVLHYVNYGRNPDIQDNFGTTILHMVASASLDSLVIVEHLLGLGANLNVIDNNHQTPLHLAVSKNNYKIADFLIANGAAVNIQDLSGKTALHLLIDDIGLQKLPVEKEKQKMKFMLVKKLLLSGADPNLPDIYGETPLMVAVKQNDFDIVKELLMFGGNVHLRNVDSDTCLHLLAWSFVPNKDILVELVKHGACVNCFDSQGESVMDFMLRHYQGKGLKTVKLLIKTATLVNYEKKIFFELGTNRKLHCLEEFSESCSEEVNRMKACNYSDKSNLCHFALNGGNFSQMDKSPGKSIFDEVLETLMNDKFPIYDDFIRARFDRTFLCDKLSKTNIYARNEENKVVYLNSYIIFDIVPHLSDEDLFNLVRAY